MTCVYKTVHNISFGFVLWSGAHRVASLADDSARWLSAGGYLHPLPTSSHFPPTTLIKIQLFVALSQIQY